MTHVQIDRDVRTASGLTLLTVRWYRTAHARRSGTGRFKALGLRIHDTERSGSDYPYGFVAEHPRYKELVTNGAE